MSRLGMMRSVLGGRTIGSSTIRSWALVLVLAIAGCSVRHDTPENRAAPSVARALTYRGPAVVTGNGDLAACPYKSDLDQYRNDMLNMKVDPGDPGYEVASAYDLRSRGCVELKQGERVNIESGSREAESRVRLSGASRTFWTTASWKSAGAISLPAETVKKIGRATK